MALVKYEATKNKTILCIKTTQANNARASYLTNKKISKGLGGLMFQALMDLCKNIGGAYIYAECVRTGVAKLVWDSHPMQESNEGNFLFLQLSLNSKLDFGCDPKTMYVE